MDYLYCKPMLNLQIKTVPDDQQRYNTVGDYYVDESGKRVFVVSDMHDWRYEMLVAIHELVESSLCRVRGITDDQIDAFDLAYQAARPEGDVSEPGDSTEAPYYHEHQFASKIEKIIADELGVDWDDYFRVSDVLMRNKEVI